MSPEELEEARRVANVVGMGQIVSGEIRNFKHACDICRKLLAHVDERDARITELEDLRLTVAQALQRPDSCSLSGLKRYVEQDIWWLREEYARQETQINVQHVRLAYLESQNQDLMANCNALRDRAWKAEGQVAVLKAALIEATAAMKYCLDEGDEDENYGPYHSLPTWRAEPNQEPFRRWAVELLKTHMPEVDWDA